MWTVRIQYWCLSQHQTSCLVLWQSSNPGIRSKQHGNEMVALIKCRGGIAEKRGLDCNANYFGKQYSGKEKADCGQYVIASSLMQEQRMRL